MLNVFYLNNKGERVEFDNKNYVLTTINDLLNYSWQYVTNDYTQKIGSFKQDVTECNATIVATGRGKHDLNYSIKNMESVFDSDLIENEPGKLFVNEFYLPCYVIACSDVEYSKDRTKCLRKYKIVTEAKMWIKDVLFKNITQMQKSLEYLKDYSTDGSITNEYDTVECKNDSIRNADIIFRSTRRQASTDLRIYRVKKDKIPSDHEGTLFSWIIRNYDTVIGITDYYGPGKNECIEIDTDKKTIFNILPNGDTVNLFSNRNVNSDYLFEKMPTGNYVYAACSKTRYGDFAADLQIVVREYYTQPELEE